MNLEKATAQILESIASILLISSADRKKWIEGEVRKTLEEFERNVKEGEVRDE